MQNSRKELPLSVVIPSFNEERNIKSTIEHIRRHTDCEIIVCDGHSTDGTVKIARKLEAKVVFETKKNIANARNEGARVAKGKILVFVDADTTPDPRFFSKAQEVFQDERVVGLGGRVMPYGPTWLEHAYFDFLNFLIWFSCKFWKPSISGNCVAYEKKAFWRVHGFDERMAASEDQDLCQRISKQGKIAFFWKLIARTSSRRLRKMGLIGLTLDWGRTTFNFLTGRVNREYELVR
jgi:glycosyltransferase involved in cell wall biosynthesis